MKNFTLLAKNCVGFTPSSTVNYIQKCKHPSHTEKVFAGLLKYVLMKINERTDKKHRCYLYVQPKKNWSQATLEAFDKAELIYYEDYDKQTNISLYKFQGEPKFNYFFIQGEQLGEKIEILFLEEL